MVSHSSEGVSSSAVSSHSANPNKHMRIQDTLHPDGISYESGDELSESESDYRSSQERLNGNGSFSNSPSSDLSGSIQHKHFDIEFERSVHRF